MSHIETLKARIEADLAPSIKSLVLDRGELTLTVKAADYLAVAQQLRDLPGLKFEQLIDLCGLDYSSYKDQPWEGPRFCVASHLLSVTHNWRLRLKVFAPEDDL